MCSFTQLEDKAFDLGRTMARHGFGFEANPYTNVNRRLEMLWSQGHATMHALQCLVQKRQQDAALHAQVGDADPQAMLHPHEPRSRAQLTVVQ